MTGGMGPDARAVPDMQAFSDRFGCTFKAHDVGDANCSARVGAPFWHVVSSAMGRQDVWFAVDTMAQVVFADLEVSGGRTEYSSPASSVLLTRST